MARLRYRCPQGHQIDTFEDTDVQDGEICGVCFRDQWWNPRIDHLRTEGKVASDHGESGWDQLFRDFQHFLLHAEDPAFQTEWRVHLEES